MIIKYYISAAPDITENLWVKVYETQSDDAGAEVYTQLLNAPHSAPRAISITGMDTVAHTIRLYGASSNTLYHEYTLEPTSETAEIFEPIRFKIGDGEALTPAANSKTYQNDLLKDMTDKQYTVLRNNYGQLFPGEHYSINSADGSFTLMGQDQFNDGEEFVVEIQPKFSKTITNDSVVGKWFGGFLDIPSNVSYAADHLRKLRRFTGTATYTFSGAIPVGYTHSFNNYGTGTGTIQFSNAPLKWPGGNKTSIQLPQECEAGFSFDGTFWNVVYLSDGAIAATNPQPVAGDILHAGEFVLQTAGHTDGDVPSGDPQWTVTHGKAISGDYMVLLSLKTNNASTYYNNNKIAAPTWWHHPTDKANKFNFSLQEIDSVVNNLTVAYVLVKL